MMNNPLNPLAGIHYLEQTDSTMLEARRLTERGAASGSVVVAGSQSAGRGRSSGRRWEVNTGDGLMFTVTFSREDLERRMAGKTFTLLPLLCGLAVAEAAEQYLDLLSVNNSSPAALRIKWPNDVLAGGRKLCGILCEASGDSVYAGIGINLNQTNFPENLRRPACSIKMLTGKHSGADAGGFAGDALLGLVLERLGCAVEASGWKHEIENRLYMIGESVSILTGPPDEDRPAAGETLFPEPLLLTGRLSGISDSGMLLLETEAGLKSIVSGELRI